MKREFWKRDWFSAVAVTALFATAAFHGAGFLETLERAAYDVAVVRADQDRLPSEKIAVIAVDDASIERLGPWPWPRTLLAELLAGLAQVQPRLVALQVFLGERRQDPGLVHVQRLHDFLSESGLVAAAPAEAAQMAALLADAELALDQDARLAETLPLAGNVFMPLFFQVGLPLVRPEAPLPDFVRRNRLTQVLPSAAPISPPATTRVLYPLPDFGAAAAGLGHVTPIPDGDGAVRSEALVLEHAADHYPSLALLLAAHRLNLAPRDIVVALGKEVRLGRLVIKTDPGMRMHTGFYADDPDRAPYTLYPFHAVHSGQIPLETFKNRMVLIGATALGVGTTSATPVSNAMHGPALTAHTVMSILDRRFFTRPAWAGWTETVLFIVVLAYLMFVLPHFNTAMSGLLSLSLFTALLGGGHYLLVTEHAWLKTVTPALLLLTGHVWLATKRLFWTEQAGSGVEQDAAQINRMLGLAFQRQGQLDMAMDKFCALPVEESVLELIYNVALDFERRRQFNKAIAAYDYILQQDARFRDAAKRRRRAQQAESAVVAGKGSTAGGALVPDADGKSRLGRYLVEKELARGAMGAVYLGRDTRINRVVAIKTMALSQEFDGNELAEVKQRFFREAETAGRLSHPHIVTIYDAGEDRGLAYIAMEFLQGMDLTRFTDPKRLLPAPVVLQLVTRIADALDYAHRQGVVHRDIKPGNIVYDPKAKSLKITDFGIARVTASSRTKTGVIMGTPSYMSPEQLTGRHVDGRSDLFSLGVMLFELLTGQLPFRGESMAALMFQIANEKHPDLLQVRPRLPPALGPVVDTALQKNPDLRFQTGADFRQAIYQCVQGEKK